MTTGVTPQGFVPKTVDDIVTDMETNALSTIDPSLDLSAEGPLGQIFGIVADTAAQLWELGALSYNGMSRDHAEGPQLDNVNGLTGTKRKSAFPSYTLQTNVFSQVGTFVAGSLVANVSGLTSVQFASGEDIVIALVGGNYTATVNNLVVATSATLPITVLGTKFLCTVDGPTVANASTLTAITNPVTGWTSTTNPSDASLGALVEQDTPYRLRGDQEISAAGSGNPDAMRADVLNVPGVLQAFVIENNTNGFDAYGNPPHSFLVVIWDGASPAANDTAVAQAIWNDKPTGISYSPSAQIVDGIAVDTQGNQHVMGFNRAQQLTLYVTMTGVVMFPGFTLDAPTALAIKQALVAATQNPLLTAPNGTQADNPAYLGLGSTCYAEALRSAILSAGLNVLNIPAASFKLGFTASPSGTTDLLANQLQIIIADSSRCLVNGL